MQFIDLAAQQARIRDKLDERIASVMDHGKYIMGPEVRELEEKLAEYCGAKSPAISCANGTDAIALVLMAMCIGPGDAVICPTFTFAATAEVVALQGATPVFCDVLPETFNMDPQNLKAAIVEAREEGLNLRAVICVDLFGQPADYDVIEQICDENGLALICDAAQGFGGIYKGRGVGTIGKATTTSFFPAKPLGCYGDGGAIFTEDEELREGIESLRVHGKGSNKYDNTRIGLNSRLDTMQAAILLEKLAIFGDEVKSRNVVADRYQEGLGGLNSISCPRVPEGLTSSWAQYTLRLAVEKRDALASHLKERGIPSMIYYPTPLHMLSAYEHFPRAKGLETAPSLSKQVLSLPMHPYLTEEDQAAVIEGVVEFTKH